jgi:large subunit ribosomal protein L17
MRHLKHRSELSRTKEHREALLANLSAALITHGRIQTGLIKAKALRPFVEKVITLAVKASKATNPADALHFRRQAIAKVRDKDAIAILFKDRVSEFANRQGGYTRIYKLGQRVGDAAEMALIELIAGNDLGYKAPKAAAEAAAAPAAEAAPAVEAAPQA